MSSSKHQHDSNSSGNIAHGAVRADVIGGVGVLTLDRPKALNALSLEMVRQLHDALRGWVDDGAVHGVLLRGAPRLEADGRPGPAHFCAGGDIRFMHEAATTGDLRIDDFFTEEYALDHALHVYPKPVVAWLEGITMGGGMGLAQGCSLRVVTEGVRMAMPETRIGLFPDVGGGHFLSRLPGHLGEYLGIVGPHFNAADALGLKLADVAARAGTLDALLDGIAQAPVASGDAWLRHVQGHARDHAPAELPASTLDDVLRARVDRHFGLPTMQAIEASLREDDSEWAAQTLRQMAGHSPLMMCVTLEQIRRARGMSLADVFRMERTLVRHCLNLHRGAASETVEGVRALAVDKDHRPRWNPPALAEVTPAMVQAFFETAWPPHAHPLRDLADPV